MNGLSDQQELTPPDTWTRIRDWAQMTPEQRRAARETFQGLRRLPPERQHELRERWLREHPERSHR